MSDAPVIRFLDRQTPPHVLTLVMVAGLAAMNMSVFLPSLPQMTAYFGTDYAVMQFAVSGYLATTALLQLVIGPISDRFGRRPVILGSIVLFILATIGCALSTSVEMFLLFRMLQGVIATGLVLSRATVRDMVADAQAASMIGYVTMGMSLVPMFAPMVGGLLDEAYGWRATFLFLIVTGFAVLALVWADQGETLQRTGESFRDKVRQYPELLSSPRFWGYVFSSAFASGAFFAYLGGAPYVATHVFNLPPGMTGVLLGLPAVGYAVGNFLTGRYSVRAGIDNMVLWGTLISTGGMAISLTLSMAGIGGPWLFFGFCTTIGLGNGMVMPNAGAGLLGVRPRLAGTASGLGSAIMIGAGAAMSAASGAALTLGGGSLPLQWIMFATSACSVVSIVFVMQRNRALPAS
jgi:DHA1 family bicyclomycin/chloramphenicol resistance-like MFS transporter